MSSPAGSPINNNRSMRGIRNPEQSVKQTVVMCGSCPRTNNPSSTCNVPNLYALGAEWAQNINTKAKIANKNLTYLHCARPPYIDALWINCQHRKYELHEMRNQTHKSPSYNPVITHVHTSIYGCLIPVYSIGCPRKIQIWESGRSGRWMWVNEDIVMWDRGWGNKMEFEFHEPG